MIAINANQLLSEVESLPLDLKTKLIEKLLSSLNPSHTDIDALWKEEIESRVTDVKSGNVDLIDGSEVFQKIRNRFAK
ncbi:MAG TPA: addiction module protein [Campylobacteraceae bacterium]|nr:addiction module protein [Campylobacteraceae bacterium]